MDLKIAVILLFCLRFYNVLADGLEEGKLFIILLSERGACEYANESRTPSDSRRNLVILAQFFCGKEKIIK